VKSLLFQGGLSVPEPPGCAALPCRSETSVSIKKNGRIYRFVVRDQILPEDPFLVLAKAAGFARQTDTAYAGRSPKRSVRDYLIKDNVVI
jgi:hypothetical protein